VPALALFYIVLEGNLGISKIAALNSGT